MQKFDFSKLDVIGRGSYATVYAHPTDNNKIVKYLCFVPSYVKFLDYYQHTLNARKHWAKIFSIDITENGAIIVQEKIAKNNLTYKEFQTYQGQTKKDSDLKELVWLLQEICRRHNMCYDVHPANLGKRDDDSIAIFDPFC